MNEQQLYRRLKIWLDKLVAAGAPLWWTKTYGSSFVRDLPDLVLCIAGRFVAIELKAPDNPKATPTPKQLRTLKLITDAGGEASWSNDEELTKALIAEMLLVHGDWRHPTLTEPSLIFAANYAVTH